MAATAGWIFFTRRKGRWGRSQWQPPRSTGKVSSDMRDPLASRRWREPSPGAKARRPLRESGEGLVVRLIAQRQDADVAHAASSRGAATRGFTPSVGIPDRYRRLRFCVHGDLRLLLDRAILAGTCESGGGDFAGSQKPSSVCDVLAGANPGGLRIELGVRAGVWIHCGKIGDARKSC